jgi:hypothetical protein
MQARAQGSAGNADGHLALAADQYLTDEVFLYRVVGLVAGEGAGMVELEDCYWLDVVRVPIAGVQGRQLRVVTPGPLSARNEVGESRAAFVRELTHAGTSRSV